MASVLGGSSTGRWLVSRLVSAKAPYFATIRPTFLRLEPGYVEVRVPDRRAIHNHLGTVHAIAMCNAAELVAGTCVELTLDASLRWIPVGMTVRYEKLARTDLRARCDARGVDLATVGDKILPVEIVDTADVRVFSADITMRLSARKSG
jgi:acyl-coenzyme A thioesterase PaaI-like protein